MSKTPRYETIIGVIGFLEKHNIPSYDFIVHNVIFLLEFAYNIETGYGFSLWIPQPYGVWNDDLYYDTRILIEKSILYRTETGELKVLTKGFRQIKIPYKLYIQLRKKKLRDLVRLVHKAYSTVYNK